MSLDEVSESDGTPVTVSEHSCVHDLVPIVIRLARAILHCTRWSMFHLLADFIQADNSEKVTFQCCFIIGTPIIVTNFRYS